MNRTMPSHSLDGPASTASAPCGAAAWAVEPPLSALAVALTRSAYLRYSSQNPLRGGDEVVGRGVLTIQVPAHLAVRIEQDDPRRVRQFGTAGRWRTGGRARRTGRQL